VADADPGKDQSGQGDSGDGAFGHS
jgi:hypothetical protein